MRSEMAEADSSVVATPPRIITPNRPVFLTLRATGRQFRFLPTAEVTQSIKFIFWHCVDVYGIKVHDVNWMSNHAHICLLDEKGVLPAFTCKMNSMISRQLNALRRQRGSNIEKGYSDITVLDDWTMASFCAYTLANPCAADLVSKAGAWGGFTSYALEYGEKFTVTRPNCGMWKEGEKSEYGSRTLPKVFRPKLRLGKEPSKQDQIVASVQKKPSKLPRAVEGVLTRPNILPRLNNTELRTLIRRETARREEMAAQRRAHVGKGVLGMRGVLAMRWNDVPVCYEAPFDEIPRIATRSAVDAIRYRKYIGEFNHRYARERDRFIVLGKDHARFPYGTWKMRVDLLATCDRSPPPGVFGSG